MKSFVTKQASSNLFFQDTENTYGSIVVSLTNSDNSEEVIITEDEIDAYEKEMGTIIPNELLSQKQLTRLIEYLKAKKLLEYQTLNEEEMDHIMEISHFALHDPSIFEQVADHMDLSDECLVLLKEKLDRIQNPPENQ